MFITRFEGTSPEQKTAIEACVAKMLPVAAFAVTVGDARISRWFGNGALPGAAEYQDFNARRIKMNTYLSTKCSLMTFVKVNLGQIIDEDPCRHGDIAQVVRSAFSSQTVRGQKARFSESDGFVPSGLRVFIHPGFMIRSSGAPRAFDNQFNTPMHEISHRVIATTDHWYGEQDSLEAARADDPLAVDCAENWGFFYADLLPFV
jgi:hypothetical protein